MQRNSKTEVKINKQWTSHGEPYWYITVISETGRAKPKKTARVICDDGLAMHLSETRRYMFDSYEEAEAVLAAAKIRGDVW